MLALLLSLQIGAVPPQPSLHPLHRPATKAAAPGKTRHYYIAADEVIWDYAPQAMNLITGRAFDPFQQLFTARGPHQIGSKSKKALYREYTDATFRTLKPRAPEDGYLGFLGPVIRAEVGETLKVMFKNNATRPYSMHPHGVFYEKSSEGAGYQDNTGVVQEGNAVQSGKTFTYTWIASERAGPASMEGSSVLWMYHSHVSESADINTGLIGALIVTARGRARADGSPKDVDRELVVAFAELDENLSWYFDDNIKQYTLDPAGVKKAVGPTFVDPFGATNLRESINGFLYGNGPVPTMKEGQRVRWYVMSTTNFELHAPHWHGNIVTAQHMKTDVITLGTMGMVVADMIADNPGTWLFHCHIEPHFMAGMQTRFTVLPKSMASRPN
ncbi:MAG: multicopper oxidase domain-containing protein [Gemmatimonadaceae bacterium]